MTSRIRDTDRGAKALTQRLQDLGRAGVIRLTAGVHADTGAESHPSGSTVGEVAVYMEMGTNDTAPHGYLRATFDAQREGLGPRIAASGARVLRGETIGEAFGELVADFADDVRAAAPVDTAKLRQSIEGRVNGVRVSR